MARKRPPPRPDETAISIVGAGMRIAGDCDSEHTIRIDGVIEGAVRSKKGVVIGRSGRVEGDVHAADAKIAGTVKGALVVEARLELEGTAVVDGEIRTARMKLDEGAIVSGTVAVGRQEKPVAAPAEPKAQAAPDKPLPAEPKAEAEKQDAGGSGSLFPSGRKRRVSA